MEFYRKRGTLRTEWESGRVWVILEDTLPRQGAAPPRPQAQLGDRAELVDELREKVAFLERELKFRTEEHRRKDYLLAALERIPALEPPESSETPTDHAPNISPPETETPAETPSWRWLGV
jgi:hypothetical protein